MALDKVIYKNNETVISAENLNDIQDAVVELEALSETFAPATHTHDEYSPTTHTHDEYSPSGFGYGGTAVLLSSTFLRSDAELEAALEPILRSIAGGETKLIRFVGYPDNSDYSWFGILSNSSNNYGSMFAHSAYNCGQMISKAKVGGIWQPLEWEHPPMVLGVEYRTTERYKGKPVYTKLVDFGSLPNTTFKSIETGVVNGCDILSVTGQTSSNVIIPYLSRSVITSGKYEQGYQIIFQNISAGSITISCASDYSSLTATVLIKYTKTTD